MVLISSLIMLSCSDGFLQGGNPGAIQVGSIIGGAVGGVIGNNADHWNGYPIGSMIGTIAGAVIANEATKPKENQSYDNYSERSNPSKSLNSTDGNEHVNNAKLIIQNIRFIDQNRNQVIDKGEKCHLIFEISNSGFITAYRVSPILTIVNGDELTLSTPSQVKMLMPGEVIIYDIIIHADRRLSSGFSTLRIDISDRNGYYADYRQFTLNTQKE